MLFEKKKEMRWVRIQSRELYKLIRTRGNMGHISEINNNKFCSKRNRSLIRQKKYGNRCQLGMPTSIEIEVW